MCIRDRNKEAFNFLAFNVIKVVYFFERHKYLLRKCAVNQSKGQQVAYQIGKIIHSGFPGLSDKIMQLSDPRKHKEYSLAELVMGGIMLFVFKEGSRNAFDNDRKESSFRKNYERVFKLKLPSADAVEDLYRVLDNKELESLKSLIIKGLIERKVFHRFRFMGKRYFISIDGTGVAAYCLLYTSPSPRDRTRSRMP